MPIETYRLEIRDRDEGIDADVYGEDDLVEASARVPYEDHDLEPVDGREEPSPIVREVTADVTTVDLQYARDDAGFEFRLFGDRDDLLSERIDAEEWGLTGG